MKSVFEMRELMILKKTYATVIVLILILSCNNKKINKGNNNINEENKTAINKKEKKIAQYKSYKKHSFLFDTIKLRQIGSLIKQFGDSFIHDYFVYTYKYNVTVAKYPGRKYRNIELIKDSMAPYTDNPLTYPPIECLPKPRPITCIYDTISKTTLREKLVQKDTQIILDYISYLKEIDTFSIDFGHERVDVLLHATMFMTRIPQDKEHARVDQKLIDKVYKEEVLKKMFGYYVNSCFFMNTQIRTIGYDNYYGDISSVDSVYVYDIKKNEDLFNYDYMKLTDICNNNIIQKLIK